MAVSLVQSWLECIRLAREAASPKQVQRNRKTSVEWLVAKELTLGLHCFMPTTLNPAKEKTELQKLRALAEKTVRDVTARANELQDLIQRLNTALGETPRPSPLDEVQELVAATEDLRGSNGNLSAKAIAKAFGVSMNHLADWLGRSRQSLAKTPQADSLQNQLAYFERVARLRAVMPHERFQKWLRMAHHQLDNMSPLELLGDGEGQVVADFVDDILTGAPS